eukprot:3201329-Prymnesium_polylepis.1
MRLLANEIPVLEAVANFVDAQSVQFEISDSAKHVCKYLKAYDDASIDQHYGDGGAKDVVFVLDNSSSMSGSPLETCKRAMSNDIFVTRLHAEDRVGLIVFNSSIAVKIGMGPWQGNHRLQLEQQLQQVRSGGGTNLWSAMSDAISLLRSSSRKSKWIVALTDGASADGPLQVHHQLRDAAGVDIRVLFITVNLHHSYEATIRGTCVRANGDALIRADGGSSAIQQAWQDVGDRLTVSQKIEKQGAAMDSSECQMLLRKYMKLDGDHQQWSRLKQTHWIRYLFRRCKILAASEKFNKNKAFAAFGSTTMKIMLQEVDHFLAEDYQVDWNEVNHEQFVYCEDTVVINGKREVDYKWSVLATNPDATDTNWLQRQDLLRSLQMQVPTKADLERNDRRVLDAYLANGLGIELHSKADEMSSSGSRFDFALGSLPLIEQCQFVLTLDFVMKMLCINERIECRVPCIMEGETGVSKTALTRMLFLLKNTVARSPSALDQVLEQVDSQSSVATEQQLSALHNLSDFWHVGGDLQNNTEIWRSFDLLAIRICESKLEEVSKCILAELRADPGLDPLKDVDEDVLASCSSNAESAATLLKWYVSMRLSSSSRSLDWTFFPVDVHAALTPQDIADSSFGGVKVVIARAKRLQRLAHLLDSELHRRA